MRIKTYVDVEERQHAHQDIIRGHNALLNSHQLNQVGDDIVVAQTDSFRQTCRATRVRQCSDVFFNVHWRNNGLERQKKVSGSPSSLSANLIWIWIFWSLRYHHAWEVMRKVSHPEPRQRQISSFYPSQRFWLHPSPYRWMQARWRYILLLNRIIDALTLPSCKVDLTS